MIGYVGIVCFDAHLEAEFKVAVLSCYTFVLLKPQSENHCIRWEMEAGRSPSGMTDNWDTPLPQAHQKEGCLGVPPCCFSLGRFRFSSALQNCYFLGTKWTNTKCLMNSYKSRLLLSIFLSLSSWYHILHHLLLHWSVSSFSHLTKSTFLWGKDHKLLLSMFLVTSI